MMLRYDILPGYGTSSVSTSERSSTGPWVTYREAKQAIATARADALKEAADRAVKYFGWGLGPCTYAADALRLAILTDTPAEPVFEEHDRYVYDDAKPIDSDTPPEPEVDIAGEVWDMMCDSLLPTRGRTKLYDEIRARFPAPKNAKPPEAEPKPEPEPERGPEVGDVVWFVYRDGSGGPRLWSQWFANHNPLEGETQTRTITILMRAAEVQRRIEATK